MFRLASFLTVSIIISVVSILTVSSKTSSCICTTVQCPVIGINTLIMGNGGATIHYTYIQQNDVPVISSAEGIVTVDSLDNGSETTDCTQKYSRTLEDDGSNNCDAGHIIANRLGGYGNQPINIFPQQFSINRGAYSQFENVIYNCIKSGATKAYLSWVFLYSNSSRTMPSKVQYNAVFDKGNCTNIDANFSN